MVINRFLSIPTNETYVRESKFLKLVYVYGFTLENHSSKALTLDRDCSSKFFMRINIRWGFKYFAKISLKKNFFNKEFLSQRGDQHTIRANYKNFT